MNTSGCIYISIVMDESILLPFKSIFPAVKRQIFYAIGACLTAHENEKSEVPRSLISSIVSRTIT